MNSEEVINFFQDIQENTLAGIVVIAYYLLVTWSKIRDGLGIRFSKKTAVDLLQKKHDFIKLKIDIATLKNNTNIDKEILEKIEAEADEKFPEENQAKFTTTQKYIAVPLLLLVVLVSILELTSLEPDDDATTTDTLTGAIFTAIIVVVGFWGIPHLQKIGNSLNRRLGFIVYWTLGFYIIFYITIFLIARAIDKPELENSQAWVFLLALVVSILLGIFEMLPYMGRNSAVQCKNR